MKVIKGLSLEAKEFFMWKRAEIILKKNKSTKWCDEFTAMIAGKKALCCYVRVITRSYGFCLYESTLYRDYCRSLSGVAPRLPFIGRQESPTEKTEEHDVYVNLFHVPCKPPKDESVCSQYVRLSRLLHRTTQRTKNVSPLTNDSYPRHIFEIVVL